MPNQNYARGANMERAFVRWLRERGWIASRTPGSKGSYDVVAANGGRIVLAQLKPTERCVRRPDLERLARDAQAAGAVALLVTKPRKGFFPSRVVREDGSLGELYF